MASVQVITDPVDAVLTSRRYRKQFEKDWENHTGSPLASSVGDQWWPLSVLESEVYTRFQRVLLRLP